MRYAIYLTPHEGDPLTSVAERWLGRSAFGREVPPPQAVGAFSAAEIAFHTAPPRRYGFHATLKAPFRLAEGRTEGKLVAALDSFAATRQPFCTKLALARLGGFFALVPESASPELDQLAADVVTAFERFRAPLSADEIERRNSEDLSPAQLKYLHKWGYPFVFEAFRFHMTLTGRVPDAEAARMESAIESFFGPLLLEPLEVGTLAVFAEAEPSAPFNVCAAREIGKERQRKTA